MYPDINDLLPGVFLSYRRNDSAGHTRNIYEKLIQEIGKDHVFWDIKTPPGHDFKRIIETKVNSCGVLIAVIGNQWLSAIKERTNAQRDFVRLEISSALKGNVAVFPTLVGGAAAPDQVDLPDDIKKLANINAIELRHTSWDSDVNVLLENVKSVSLIKVFLSILSAENLRKISRKEINENWFFVFALGNTKKFLSEESLLYKVIKQTHDSLMSEIDEIIDRIAGILTVWPIRKLTGKDKELEAEIQKTIDTYYLDLRKKLISLLDGE